MRLFHTCWLILLTLTASTAQLPLSLGERFKAYATSIVQYPRRGTCVPNNTVVAFISNANHRQYLDLVTANLTTSYRDCLRDSSLLVTMDDATQDRCQASNSAFRWCYRPRFDVGPADDRSGAYADVMATKFAVWIELLQAGIDVLFFDDDVLILQPLSFEFLETHPAALLHYQPEGLNYSCYFQALALPLAERPDCNTLVKFRVNTGQLYLKADPSHRVLEALKAARTYFSQDGQRLRAQECVEVTLGVLNVPIQPLPGEYAGHCGGRQCMTC
jgi:hypothetical protein